MSADREIFDEVERATRDSVGECTSASDHETVWVDDRGWCIHCGAEFEWSDEA